MASKKPAKHVNFIFVSTKIFQFIGTKDGIKNCDQTWSLDILYFTM